MLERIAGAVDAGSLAVPDTEHAIDILAGVRLDLLRAEDGGCGELFVDSAKGFMTIGGNTYKAGDMITINGTTGAVIEAADTPMPELGA